jgi:tRNA/rRNA methyltransferase
VNDADPTDPAAATTPHPSCRVVLVRTENPANIGAAARVMRNMGVRDLVLVCPAADPRDERARQLATHHAAGLLDRCRVVPDLEAALEDCLVAAAASARTGGLFRRQTVVAPDEAALRLVGGMAGGPVALVFGPESSGLSNEEVLRCPYLVHIPADEEYPALNLAQAVAICLYEVRRCWLRQQQGPAGAGAGVATWGQQARVFAHLQSALTRVRYLRGVRGEALMHALRNLISRACPTGMEVRMLHGLARQLHWVADRADLGGTGSEDEGTG